MQRVWGDAPPDFAMSPQPELLINSALSLVVFILPLRQHGDPNWTGLTRSSCSRNPAYEGHSGRGRMVTAVSQVRRYGPGGGQQGGEGDGPGGAGWGPKKPPPNEFPVAQPACAALVAASLIQSCLLQWKIAAHPESTTRKPFTHPCTHIQPGSLGCPRWPCFLPLFQGSLYAPLDKRLCFKRRESCTNSHWLLSLQSHSSSSSLCSWRSPPPLLPSQPASGSILIKMSHTHQVPPPTLKIV